MSEHLITNEEEARKFKNQLDAYWMDLATSGRYSEHIQKFYRIDRNLPFIDNYINNDRAAILALCCSDYDFFEFLLTSDKIKNKKYSLKNLVLTLAKHEDINKECIFLVIDCFENKKEIFEDIKAKTKKIFIESCISYFTRNENFYDSNQNFLNKHEDFFFDFLKKYRVNPYENKYNLIGSLIAHNRIHTLDTLIDKAKNDEDKEKILYHQYSLSPKEVHEFLEMKIKSHEAYKEYKNLKSSLSMDDKSKSKRTKI